MNHQEGMGESDTFPFPEPFLKTGVLFKPPRLYLQVGKLSTKNLELQTTSFEWMEMVISNPSSIRKDLGTIIQLKQPFIHGYFRFQVYVCIYIYIHYTSYFHSKNWPPYQIIPMCEESPPVFFNNSSWLNTEKKNNSFFLTTTKNLRLLMPKLWIS